MSIEVQKRKADEVIEKLRPLTPAFVAGGAPSNWYQGVEANDIDMFLPYPHPDQVALEEALGVKVEPLCDELYATRFDGYEWTDEDGQKFQLLLHDVTLVDEMLERFPFSVCRVAYLGGGVFRYGNLFELSIRHKFVADNVSLPCNKGFLDKYYVKYPVEEWDWVGGSNNKIVLVEMGAKWKARYTHGT